MSSSSWVNGSPSAVPCTSIMRFVDEYRAPEQVMQLIEHLREVPSKMIGNLVMEQLKKLDKVAYIRFASVYRSFEDIKEFGEEIARLED